MCPPPCLRDKIAAMSSNHISQHPIGVFDSGVGGLSVLRALRALLPMEEIIYMGDQYHVPYGPRPLAEVRQLSQAVTRFLLNQGAKLIVVACNAASAASLHQLRLDFPSTPFVGMEPAVKPAAESTHTRHVGVLATPATFQGALYASVVERFAKDVILHQDVCLGLVRQIEQGAVQDAATRQILEKALLPMLAEGIDTVVLGCTHYPFVIPLIEEIVGQGVRVIDPAPAVARQVQRLLLERQALNRQMTQGKLVFYTSGDAPAFERLLPQLLGERGEVIPVYWRAGEVSLLASG